MRIRYCKPGCGYPNPGIVVSIDEPRVPLALTFIEDVLARGPYTKPNLGGIPHVVYQPDRCRIVVDFTGWDEWEGSQEDIMNMTAQIADHLNLSWEIVE